MPCRPFLALVLVTVFAGGARAEDWRYVVPPAGAEHEHPPPRVVGLGRQKPDDLTETARYRGKTRRYGQLHYGSPGSPRVAFVLDEISADDVDLYVDAARRRSITPKDRVAGADGVWRVPLDVAFVDAGETRYAPRTLLFRLGKTTRTLSVATCGYLEGTARLGGHTVAVRRVDGDANGLFADPADRLWIDLDGDGRWDALEEQFLFAPILTFGAARYAVRSDPLGRSLAFEKLEGVGTVRVVVARPEVAGRVEDLSATLVGRDGSVFTLRGHGASAALPAGDYRMSVVSIVLKDPAGGSSWGFIFSDSGGERPARWHKVDKGATVSVDPVGKLDFVVGLDDDSRTRCPGDPVELRPGLYTEGGLLINTAYRGANPSSNSRECGAEVSLTADGRALANAASHFA